MSVFGGTIIVSAAPAWDVDVDVEALVDCAVAADDDEVAAMDVRPFEMSPDVVNMLVLAVVWAAFDVVLLLGVMVFVEDVDESIGMELKPGWIVSVFGITKVDAATDVAAAPDVDVKVPTGIELSPFTTFPVVVSIVSVVFVG